jgi:hypothetical protein
MRFFSKETDGGAVGIGPERKSRVTHGAIANFTADGNDALGAIVA